MISTQVLPPAEYRSRASWREAHRKFHEDLVRALLLHIEAHATRPHSDLNLIDIDGWSADAIGYHIMLMEREGLISATIDRMGDTEDPDLTHVSYSVHGLWVDGHELLEAVREQGAWREIKALARRGGAVTVRSLMRVAEAYLAGKIDALIRP